MASEREYPRVVLEKRFAGAGDVRVTQTGAVRFTFAHRTQGSAEWLDMRAQPTPTMCAVLADLLAQTRGESR